MNAGKKSSNNFGPVKRNIKEIDNHVTFQNVGPECKLPKKSLENNKSEQTYFNPSSLDIKRDFYYDSPICSSKCGTNLPKKYNYPIKEGENTCRINNRINKTKYSTKCPVENKPLFLKPNNKQSLTPIVTRPETRHHLIDVHGLAVFLRQATRCLRCYRSDSLHMIGTICRQQPPSVTGITLKCVYCCFIVHTDLVKPKTFLLTENNEDNINELSNHCNVSSFNSAKQPNSTSSLNQPMEEVLRKEKSQQNDNKSAVGLASNYTKNETTESKTLLECPLPTNPTKNTTQPNCDNLKRDSCMLSSDLHSFLSYLDIRTKAGHPVPKVNISWIPGITPSTKEQKGNELQGEDISIVTEKKTFSEINQLSDKADCNMSSCSCNIENTACVTSPNDMIKNDGVVNGMSNTDVNMEDGSSVSIKNRDSKFNDENIFNENNLLSNYKNIRNESNLLTTQNHMQFKLDFNNSKASHVVDNAAWNVFQNKNKNEKLISVGNEVTKKDEGKGKKKTLSEQISSIEKEIFSQNLPIRIAEDETAAKLSKTNYVRSTNPDSFLTSVIKNELPENNDSTNALSDSKIISNLYKATESGSEIKIKQEIFVDQNTESEELCYMECEDKANNFTQLGETQVFTDEKYDPTNPMTSKPDSVCEQMPFQSNIFEYILPDKFIFNEYPGLIVPDIYVNPLVKGISTTNKQRFKESKHNNHDNETNPDTMDTYLEIRDNNPEAKKITGEISDTSFVEESFIDKTVYSKSSKLDNDFHFQDLDACTSLTKESDCEEVKHSYRFHDLISSDSDSEAPRLIP